MSQTQTERMKHLYLAFLITVRWWVTSLTKPKHTCRKKGPSTRWIGSWLNATDGLAEMVKWGGGPRPLRGIELFHPARIYTVPERAMAFHIWPLVNWIIMSISEIYFNHKFHILWLQVDPRRVKIFRGSNLLHVQLERSLSDVNNIT